jgi:hypothetical protein
MTFFAGIVRFSSCFYVYINLFIWINLLYLGTKFLLIEMYNLFPYISHLSCTSNIWGGEVYLFLRKNCEKVCLSWRKVDFPSDSPNKTMIPEEIWTKKPEPGPDFLLRFLYWLNSKHKVRIFARFCTSGERQKLLVKQKLPTINWGGYFSSNSSGLSFPA